MAYSSNYQITIDNTKVGGTSGTITDYTHLIRGRLSGIGGGPDISTINNTDTSGGASSSMEVPADLAFYDDNLATTKYDHEVLFYNPNTQDFAAQVRIPSLNKGSDTSYYMHWNDAAVTTSQENIGGVWDASHKGVWHLSEATGTRYDSSGNGNHLTDNNSVVNATGKVNKGADFESSLSQYLSITDASQTGLDITGDLSYVFWIKYETLPGNGVIGGVMGKWNTGSSGNWSYGFFDYYTGADYLFGTFSSEDGTTNNNQNTAVTISADTWYRVVALVDISVPQTTFYVNGSSVGSSTNGSQTSLFYDGNLPFRIGNFGDSAYLDAVVEGVRIYNGLFDADWITTDYNNQNSPDTFDNISNTSFDPTPPVSSSFITRNSTII